MDPAIIYQMSRSPQLFDVQVVSSQIFSWVLRLGPDFKEYLAHILSMSRVTFIEVIDWYHMDASAKIFGYDNFSSYDVDFHVSKMVFYICIASEYGKVVEW